MTIVHQKPRTSKAKEPSHVTCGTVDGGASPDPEDDRPDAGLIALCPAHFRKEEEQFFPAAMETLCPPEQQDLIERFHEADRRLIHEHYALLVCQWRPAGAPTK